MIVHFILWNIIITVKTMYKIDHSMETIDSYFIQQKIRIKSNKNDSNVELYYLRKINF